MSDPNDVPAAKVGWGFRFDGGSVADAIAQVEAATGLLFRHYVTIIPRAHIRECPPFIQAIAAENDALDEALADEEWFE